jgi:hypothetical protein
MITLLPGAVGAFMAANAAGAASRCNPLLVLDQRGVQR